jgi:hypothetical protein
LFVSPICCRIFGVVTTYLNRRNLIRRLLAKKASFHPLLPLDYHLADDNNDDSEAVDIDKKDLRA